MKGDGKKKDMMFIPVKNGLIKIHIYGFYLPGNWGKVYAELNGTLVKSEGYHRKRTIIRCLSKLHKTLSS